MRIYFLCESAAGLKLNGAYAGVIDGFEKFAEIGLSDRVLAEVIPVNGAAPVSFFIDENLLKTPPAFADVYLSDGDAVVYIKKQEEKTRKIRVIAQKQTPDTLCTLFSDGGIYLSCEGETCNLYELGADFENAVLTEKTLAGFPVIAVEGKGCLAIISAQGKRIFFNPAESWEFGDLLKITVNFNTCAGCAAECEFSYDGREMKLVKSVTTEKHPVGEDLIQFAFFESVLTRGDYARYLSEELKDKAEAIFGFLGEFVDVTIPYSRFFERHGDIKAAGLVYPVAANLFNIKYFAVDVENAKITNVCEVE